MLARIFDFEEEPEPEPTQGPESSPRKILIREIAKSLTPEASPAMQAALVNKKSTRKRVQAKTGEILTEPEAVERLRKEEEERNAKKTPKEKTPKEKNPTVKKGKSSKGKKPVKASSVKPPPAALKPAVPAEHTTPAEPAMPGGPAIPVEPAEPAASAETTMPAETTVPAVPGVAVVPMGPAVPPRRVLFESSKDSDSDESVVSPKPKRKTRRLKVFQIMDDSDDDLMPVRSRTDSAKTKPDKDNSRPGGPIAKSFEKILSLEDPSNIEDFSNLSFD